MRERSQFFVVIAIFIFLFAVMSASAQHAAKGNANANDDATASAGQKVAVDPATGKIRKPTQEEIQQLVSGLELNDSVEGLTPRIVGTSTVAVDLEGRFENVMIVKINPDGTLAKACVASANDAKKFLKSDPPKASTKSDPSTWEVK